METSSNYRTQGLDGLSEAKLLQVLGTPQENRITTRDDQPHSEPTAPQYLVYPVQLGDVDPKHILNQACVVDFGESFQVSQPPDDLGTPGPYRSPELILDKSAGIASDLWALGCKLFEIRTGRQLFATFGNEDDEYLDAMVLLLGKLPKPWWSTGWKGRRKVFQDETDELGRVGYVTLDNESPPDPNGHPSGRGEVPRGENHAGFVVYVV